MFISLERRQGSPGREQATTQLRASRPRGGPFHRDGRNDVVRSPQQFTPHSSSEVGRRRIYVEVTQKSPLLAVQFVLNTRCLPVTVSRLTHTIDCPLPPRTCTRLSGQVPAEPSGRGDLHRRPARTRVVSATYRGVRDCRSGGNEEKEAVPPAPAARHPPRSMWRGVKRPVITAPDGVEGRGSGGEGPRVRVSPDCTGQPANPAAAAPVSGPRTDSRRRCVDYRSDGGLVPAADVRPSGLGRLPGQGHIADHHLT